MYTKGLQLRTLVTANRKLELSLVEIEVPEPGENEVVVQIQAAPINPSDLALLFGPADPDTVKVSGSAERPVVTADIDEQYMQSVAARVGQSLAVGNEGAGLVVAAGAADAAQALLGKTVGLIGGEMFSQFRCVNVAQTLALEPGTSATEGASCFVNPLTALSMTELMRMEGHSALVHTAAASNLGQMLNRICLQDNIELINIVRKPEQEELLKDLGAKYICNSGDDNFHAGLTEMLVTTGATLAFDAIGGGKLAGIILSCMEAAAAKSMTEYNRYGSDVYKQVYIYGALDVGPTILKRNFGFSWGVGAFLLTPFLQRVGNEKAMEMRARVAAEIKTTFASHYTREVSLAEALSKDAIDVYSKRITGEKFLIKPQHG